MNYLVAVSGGVDSVVLLDMLSQTDHQLVVAHVDHGIRGEESAADARFVNALAIKYGLPCITTELKLGARASEELARTRRYEFLFDKAKEYDAEIVTAHHLDDLVETVALNLERGTGWRGLTVLNRSGIYRPLLALPKSKLYEYALVHHLEWVEDATNATDAYQRNRLRARLRRSDVNREMVAALRETQLRLRHEINREVTQLTSQRGSRYFLNQLEPDVASELLGAEIAAQGVPRPTRPQLLRALHAVKTAVPRTEFQVAKGVSLHFTARNYTVTVI